MVITLQGWLQHRELHNLAVLCAENSVPCPAGYFTDTEFISEEDIPIEISELIATTFAPKSAAEKNSERKAEILAELASIDTASLRPLRAIAAGTATQFDTDKLAQLDARATALRAELATL